MTSERGVISYPIPLYANVPIHDEYYQPRFFFISAITLGQTTFVTTTTDVDYVLGQEIRLLIPPSFGSYQLNGKTGFVLSLPATDQVEISIDSTYADPFILSSSNVQSAQILALGDINTGVISNTGRNVPTTNIPGAFINISP